MTKSGFVTKLSNQKNSIQTRILLPTILVMLFQVVLISVVLSLSGTIDSLEKSAMDSLYRNAENRSITLENLMVHTWGNLDRFELDFTDVADHFLGETNQTAQQVFGNSEQEQALLEALSDSVIYALRTTSTTGAFVFFLDQDDLQAPQASLDGLYFRDYNPVMTSANNSDLLLEKGPAVIAQQQGIPLSSLWSERYTLQTEQTATWEAVFAPYQAALEYPSLSTNDLALWSDIHYLEPSSRLDSNVCVTYSRPLFYRDRLVGVIGVELQAEYLKTYFPYGDIGEMGGYMLLRFCNSTDNSQVMETTVGAATGSYIKRLADFGDLLHLAVSDSSHLYQVENNIFPPTTVAVYPLKLYNSYAPHSSRQWALASLLPNSMLFDTSSRIRSSILNSSLFSLALGFALILICIRLTTRPLLNIVRQLEQGSAGDFVEENSKTYEVRLLRDTINDMKQKERNIQIALREEGERYMLALESAVDLFIEYDLVNDCLRIYFFGEADQALTAMILEQYQTAPTDTICHPSDRKTFVAVLTGQQSEGCQIRLRRDIFPAGKAGPADGDYYWFSFHAARLHSTDGDELPEKTIGSAKDITADKLEEFALLEAQRRDLTTGAYHRTYGEYLLARSECREGSSVIAIAAGNFDRFEAYYGRVFAGSMLRQVSARLLTREPELHQLIRWNNDAFVAMCPTGQAVDLARQLVALVQEVYQGENDELRFTLHAGVSACRSDRRPDESLPLALAAAYLGRSSGAELIDYDALPPGRMPLPAGAGQPYASIDISRNTILPYTFSLFEQTNDIRSVMHMLLRALGELFALDRIIICEYDEDFGANQVSYQWNTARLPIYQDEMERISPEDFTTLTELLDEQERLVYRSSELSNYGAGVRRLLCAEDELDLSALCCAMYESGVHVGRILFFSAMPNWRPTESEVFSLYEVTKIISTRFNLEKSHSASWAKSEFLSKMSHEIRTPMNAIVGFTRMAKEANGNEGQIQNALKKIDVSAKHLLALINDILDMSRIESGKLKIEPAPFSLTCLVANLDILMRPQLEDQGLQFVVDSDILHPVVTGDEQKLRQIMINLLSNACKFTTAGRVSLSVTQQADGGVRFAVTDTGVGIAKEDQFHIFNAFEQSLASNQAAGNPVGTGLGLAISNNFVSAMGGRIELRSAPGEGSCFYFTLHLPFCEDVAMQPAATPGSKEEIDRLRGLRVLLVDDNEINLEIASFIIEEIGLAGEMARNGQEAVNMFLAQPPGYYDLIFMDISMPVMDGFAATREIRRRTERSDARSIPIVAMTANAFSEDTKKSMEAGMNAHVAKPINMDFLQSTLLSLFPADPAKS